jgi:predicted helicase
LSQLLIQHYLNELQTLRRVSGTSRESVVSEAFKTLLKDWGRSRDLIFIPQYEYQTLQKTRVVPDGALLHSLRVPLGYWEAKDEEDDIDAEIEKKFRKGYPQDNIVFEDSDEAVLIQNKQLVMRCGVEDAAQLQKLLELFFGYEREEIADFRKAVEQFKTDLPEVLKALREMIEQAEKDNDKFCKASLRFLKHAQDTINPSVTAADVREMLIQHILTEEIFSQVFDDSNFHRQNNVAKELYALENTFFTGKVKHDTLASLRPYYAAIKSAAALVTGHHEKQSFLKTIYENFYKVYNKKAADRLGVVYTPNEIVRFMIESADWLCQKHFGKSLIDKQVEILDPAVGTGTFITELIEHFRGQPQKLRYKYLEELSANEVAILSYYVANLNIEATYAAINGYEEYPNLCFVDTLDNTAALRTHKGQQIEMFGALSEENVERIKRQNKKKISVIIGNPPYNANQLNENENNKNREYPEIDRRIKETYIAASNAQKTKLYDMYARFFRWASDRVDDNGIIAFITNRSFVDSRTFDGFRETVADEFSDIYVVDLGGDVRADPRLSGTKHNIFGIQTGVAISFFVKRAKSQGFRLRYVRRPQLETRDEKLAFLAASRISSIDFEEISPSQKSDWLNLGGDEFKSFMPVGERKSEGRANIQHAKAIFGQIAPGILTGRDEWVFDFDRSVLISKIKFFIDRYNKNASKVVGVKKADLNDLLDYEIKWSETIKNLMIQGKALAFDQNKIVSHQYRPFSKREFYADLNLADRLTSLHQKFFGENLDKSNRQITFVFGTRLPFCVLAANCSSSYSIYSLDPAQCAPFERIDATGGRTSNITDWALEEFRKRYDSGGRSKKPVTKDAIFQYVYAVLYDPVYREKYALNLKRDFPSIPFYEDFWKWEGWGKALMNLHIGYDQVEVWPLQRVDMSDEKSRKAGLAPKAVLRADKESGNIRLDSETQLSGVPPEAWAYRLGNRSALEWVLDQYKEKTPKDPTIRDKFNTYRFADHKEKVVDLLKRVTRVSVETMNRGPGDDRRLRANCSDHVWAVPSAGQCIILLLSMAGCFAGGVFLHWFGRAVLGRLRE